MLKTGVITEGLIRDLEYAWESTSISRTVSSCCPWHASSSCPLGDGRMGAYYADIAPALKGDGYVGTIPLESVHTPVYTVRRDEYRMSLPVFQGTLS